MITIVGIDAGGSKTRIVATSEDALRTLLSVKPSDVEEMILGPGNFRQIGVEGIRAIGCSIRERFAITTPEAVRLIGGFAGAGTADSQEQIRQAFEAEGFRRERISITSDVGLLLRALRDRGIVLVAGTGSICMGRDGDWVIQSPTREVRAGGWGYRVGDEGSGYDLGRRAINAAARVEDGRSLQQPTVLYERVRAYFGLTNLYAVVDLLYPLDASHPSVQELVAGLAREVLQAAHDGDRVARGFVAEAVTELADHVQAVYQRLGMESAVVALHGGLFKHTHAEELLIAPLRTHPLVKNLNITFETMGVQPGDRDALIEALKSTVERQRE